MRKILYLVLPFVALVAFGQEDRQAYEASYDEEPIEVDIHSEQSFIDSLAVPTPEGYRVEVKNNTPVDFGSIEGEKLSGYRVRIFFDNKQSSREDAQKAESEFKALYPYLPSTISYQAPYFKVTAGAFLTKTEAVLIWGKLLKNFKTAFLVKDSINIEEFYYTPLDTTNIVLDSLLKGNL